MTAILTYHHIADPPPPGSPHRGLFVSPDRFAGQMECLQHRGYAAVSLDALRDDLLGHRPLPRRSVAITFDDGGADNFSHALPVLHRFGWPATVFVVAGRLGQPRDKPGWPQDAARYLSEREIGELVAADIAIGSHTVSHVRLHDLSKTDPDRCQAEVRESKRLLETVTGRPVRWLSYPFGSFSQSAIDAVRRAGYVGAVSTIRDNRPRPEQLYFLPRVMVMPDVSVRRFLYYLSPAYHWVHWFKNRRRWGKHAQQGTG